MAEPEYGLRSVCELTGLIESTLRAWEDRYRAVSPRRLSNGRRIYTLADVEKLKLLVAARRAGHPISHIAKLEAADLKELVGHYAEVVRPHADTDFSVSRRAQSSFGVTPRRLFLALDRYDLHAAYDELLIMRSRVDIQTFILEVLMELFKQLAAGVNKKRICITQEHALSAMIKSILLREFFSPPKKQDSYERPRRGGIQRLAFATLECDLHEFGILMAGVLCAHRGISSFYLGPSMPISELAGAARRLQIDALVIASPNRTIQEEETRFLLGQLIDELPQKCQLFIGGGLHPRVLEDLPRERLKCFETIKDFAGFLQKGIGDPVPHL